MATQEALTVLRKAEQEMYLAHQRLRAFIEVPDHGFSPEERVKMATLLNELIDSISNYWRAFEEAAKS